MTKSLKWYDSDWLRCFFEAQDVIRRVAPEKLDAFLAAIRPLRTNLDFEVQDVPALFDEAQLAEIKSVIRSIPTTEISTYEIQTFGRLIFHDHPHFTKLQHDLTGMISRLVGEDVEPCYNFLSLYSRLGVCEPHLDSPLAKWTLDICIDQSEPWPIHFSQIIDWPERPPAFAGSDWRTEIKQSPELTFASKTLRPGNAIIFSGSSQWHYRDPLPATGRKSHCDLLFFHYIPKGMSEIVRPGNWGRLFGVPELDQIRDINSIP